MGLDVADSHTTDDGGGTLAACVTAGIGQHGDVGGQHGHGGEGVLVPTDDQAGEGGGDHQEEQPRGTALVQIPHGLFKVRLVGRADSVHLGNIFAGLVLHDGDSVVDGDDTDQALLVIHNGDGQVAVLLEQLGDILLVGGGADADHVGVHHVADFFIGGVFCQNQRPQRDNADEGTVAVGDVAVVDGFLVHAVFSDGFHRIGHGHVRPQLHQLGGHHAAGRILGVLKQFVDHAAGRRVGLGQDTLDHVSRHLLDKVCRIVNEQVVHNSLQLFIGQAVDEVLLAFGR